MKKVIALLATLALLCTMFCCVSVSAVETPTFTVTSKTAKAGDIVEINVDISNNPGIASVGISLAYDSKLTLTATPTKGTALDGGTYQPGDNTAANPYKVIWYKTGDVVGNGTFATYKFKVADDAPAGTYPITLTYDPEDVYNNDFDNVTFEIVNGVITVEGSVDQEITGVTFGDAIFAYDGTAKSIEATNLPDGVTAAYTIDGEEGNSATAVGEYKIVATLSGEGYAEKVIEATLTIRYETTRFNNGTLEVAYNFAGDNKLVVVAYSDSGKRLEKAVFVDVKAANINTAINLAEAIGTVANAESYKAMLWVDDANCQPLLDAIGWNK